MAFNNFPYTDMHELNLDWVIRTVKDMVSSFAGLKDETEADLDNMQSQIDAIRYEVENFIDTLNLPAEVRNALEDMKASGELDQVIAQALTGKVYLHVCGQKNTDTHSGVIFYNSEKHCVVHDFGYDKPLVKNYVVSNNLIVDAIIISHYHSDHIGQNGGLLLIDFLNSATLASNCKAYLPHHNLDWDSTTFNSNVMRQNEADVITALTAAGVTIVYPTQNSVFSHAGWSFNFSNLSTTAYESYRTGTQYTIYGEVQEYDTYNNYSMVVVATAYGKNVMLPADIEYKAAMWNAYSTKLADIYFIEHHSNNVVMPNEYLCGLRPKYAVVQNNVENWNNIWYSRATASNLIAGGTYPLNTYGNGEIDFTVGVDGINAYCSVDSTGGNVAIIDCNTYGNGVLENSNINGLTSPGTYNCYSYTDYNLSNVPSFMSNKGPGYIKTKLGRAGTQDLIQTVETANAPFASFSRYRTGGNWSGYYALLKSPYVCERVARTSAKWLVTPSETNYGNANTFVSCVNGMLQVSAACRFDADVAGTTDLFDTQLPVSIFLSDRVYGTGTAVPLTGGDAIPLRFYNKDGYIVMYSNATIPADTDIVFYASMPYFG